MRRSTALAPAFLAVALTAFGRPGAPDVPEISYTVTRLSNRVIVLDCLDVNMTAIATTSGIVVVDTNRNPDAMRRLRRVIEAEFGRHDFIYIVNTHGDPDHSSGNQVFPSVPLIAHQDYASFVLHGKASMLRNLWNRRSLPEDSRTGSTAPGQDSSWADGLRARNSAPEPRNAGLHAAQAARMPTVTLKDSLRLDLGDLTMELRFCGEAHTNHDIVVFVPEENLLLVGDLICSPQSPCFRIDAMADVPRLVRELEGLLQRDAGLERIVPGHGAILTRADLSSFCRTVSEQFGKVRIENSAARIVSQAIETDGIQAALERCPPPAPGSHGNLNWSEMEFGTLGNRLMRRGMVEEAVSVLQLATGALPQSAYLFGCLGDANLENDDQDAAVAAYRRSLALAPGNPHSADMLKILCAGE